MRLAIILRVTLCLLCGGAVALGILAVRTYPAERTWVDDYHRWITRDDFQPYSARRACGWRVLFCKEIPVLTGPLAAAADSMLAPVDRLTCARYPMAGCWTELGDSTLNILFYEDGWVISISRIWTPPDIAAEYDRIHERMTAAYGPSKLCPQSDDLAAKENRRWQLRDRNLGIIKVLDTRLALDEATGRIYCHTL